MAIGFLLLKVLGTAFLALFVLVQSVFFPIAAFIHCVRNTTLTTGAKIAWACLIVFTWTLGASVYGIVASQRPLYKGLGIISLVILIPLMLARKPLATYAGKQQQTAVLRTLDQIHLVDLGDADRAILKDEIAGLDMSNEVSGDLVKLLSEMLRHGYLKRDQLMDWQRFYQSKNTLDQAQLRKYILKVQMDGIRNP